MVKAAFVPYYGGKTTHIDELLQLIPQHDTYVEVFGGSAALLFAKLPSKIEVYNDIDSDLVNLFRVVRDEETCERLYKLLQFTLYSREEFETAKNCLRSGVFRDNVHRAWCYYVTLMQSFSCNCANWSYAVQKCTVSRSFYNALERFIPVQKRLRNVQVENLPWQEILKRYDSEHTFFYLDPPYVVEARHDKTLRYRHEMTLDEHKELVSTLLTVQGKCLLSAYWHNVLQPLVDAGWSVYTWQATSYSSNARQYQNARTSRQEVALCNYSDIQATLPLL